MIYKERLIKYYSGSKKLYLCKLFDVMMTDNVFEVMDEKKLIFVVLDLLKVFDSLCYSRLIVRLRNWELYVLFWNGLDVICYD